MPDGGFLSQLVGKDVHVALLPDADWIKLSQEGLPPVRAGRFFVYGAHDAGTVPARRDPDAHRGRAWPSAPAITRPPPCACPCSAISPSNGAYRNVLDLGCGTGLLAIGAVKLWRQRVLATDIDPVAIEVTRENAAANETGPLDARGGGRRHAASGDRASAPFDLILANILAGPLTRLAPDIARGAGAGRHARAFGPAALARRILFSASTARMA